MPISSRKARLPSRLPARQRVTGAASFGHPKRCISDRVKKRKGKRRRSRDEGHYICPTCGESIIIPLDPSSGSEQQYVEDCPVCCNPNVIHVEFFEVGEPARI